MATGPHGGNFQFFPTRRNPFLSNKFIEWLQRAGVCERLLEPFAGDGSLARFIKDHNWALYDIDPKHPDVISRDSLTLFPGGYSTCISNPPFLRMRGKRDISQVILETSNQSEESLHLRQNYADLYLYALELALNNCTYVAMILPQSFLSVKTKSKRLESVVAFNQKMTPARTPVLLALFGPEQRDDFEVWSDDKFIGMYQQLNSIIPQRIYGQLVTRHTDGEIGLIAVDAWNGTKARFLRGDELVSTLISACNRNIARFHVTNGCGHDKNLILDIIVKANEILSEFRNKTADLLLSPYFEIGSDAKIRRRVPFVLASRIVALAVVRSNLHIE